MRYTEKIGRILRHRIVQSAAMLQIGTAGAMLIQAIAGVVIARTLGPQEFGRYAIVMSLAAVGSVFLGAGVADAMAPVLTRTHHGGDDEGVRESLLFLGKFVLVTSALVAVLGLSMPTIAEHFYGDRLVGWLGFLILIASAISTLLLVPTQLGLQVSGHIGKLSAITFTDQLIRQVLVVSFVFAGYGIRGAVSGNVIGAVFVFIIALAFWTSLRRSWPAIPSSSELWSVVPDDGRRYVAPTLWVLADRNLAMLFGAAPISIAALFLTTSDVSYFKIALGWITLALSVLSPISVLLNTELARIQTRQPHVLRMRFLQITGVAIGASTFVTLGAALIARPVFRVLYGVQYDSAVSLVWWLIPFGALFGLGIALGPMWRAMNRVRISILINLLILAIGVPFALGALHLWGSLGAVAMVTGWYVASHAISFWYILRELGKIEKL